MPVLVFMNVYKNKSGVKLRRIHSQYKEYLYSCLNYVFTPSSIDDKIVCPCTFEMKFVGGVVTRELGFMSAELMIL